MRRAFLTCLQPCNPMTSAFMVRRHAPEGYCGAVRKKFREVFGRDCTLPDDRLLARYAITSTGDLIVILR